MSRIAAGPESVVVRVRRLAHAKGLPLPAYATADAAGLDLAAAVDARRPLVLAPGARALVPTGLVFEVPPGFEAQVRPRSGLALRHGVTVLNSPGTIDADYRGEVLVLLINHGDEPFAIRRGERIAQLVVAPATQARIVAVAATSKTARGAGGFGSTGTSGRGKKSTHKSKATAAAAKTRKNPVAAKASRASTARPVAQRKKKRSGRLA